MLRSFNWIFIHDSITICVCKYDRLLNLLKLKTKKKKQFWWNEIWIYFRQNEFNSQPLDNNMQTKSGLFISMFLNVYIYCIHCLNTCHFFLLILDKFIDPLWLVCSTFIKSLIHWNAIVVYAACMRCYSIKSFLCFISLFLAYCSWFAYLQF